MKFELDVEKLIDEGVSINQYLLCQFIYQQESKLLNYYIEQFDKFVTKVDFDALVSKELIGMHNEKSGYVFTNTFVTKKFIDKFIDKPKKSKLEEEGAEDWIDDWYNLFPKGVKSGGYLVRSDKQGCLNKMKKFIKKYPEFKKDIILKATSDYVDYYRMNNWKFMTLAHYLISKNDVSILASQCENIYDKIESGKTVDLSISQDKFNIDADDDIFGDNMDRL